MAFLYVLGWFLVFLGIVSGASAVGIALRSTSSGSFSAAFMLTPVAVLALGVGTALAIPSLFTQTALGMGMVAAGLVAFACAVGAIFVVDGGTVAIGTAAVAAVVMILGYLVNLASLLEGVV